MLQRHLCSVLLLTVRVDFFKSFCTKYFVKIQIKVFLFVFPAKTVSWDMRDATICSMFPGIQ